MPIGMLEIYRLLFVFFFVRRILVADISSMGWRRAMKFCRVVELAGQLRCEKLVTAWLMTASVVNYLYFVVIGNWHVGIYASLDNWRTCLLSFITFLVIVRNVDCASIIVHAI